MNLDMFCKSIDVLAKYHQQAHDNPSLQLTTVRMLTDIHEVLKKDKFGKKHVRDTIFKLNRPYAEGYFKAKS